jgi:hypothetical protein
LWNLDYSLFIYYLTTGRRIDLERRGFQFKESQDDIVQSFDEIAADLYTPEELAERNKFLKKQFGNDIEGL